MTKMSVLLVSSLMMASVAMAAGKKEAKKTEEVRFPASGSCTSGTIRSLTGSATNCSSGKWIATGGNFNATICCLEADEQGGGDDGGGVQAR